MWRVPDVLIQRQGDWVSLCYREYIVLTPEQALTATRQMFAAMQPVSASGRWGAALVPSDHPVGHVGVPATDAFMFE